MSSVRFNGVGLSGGSVVALAAALTAGSLVESAYAGRNVQVDRVAKGHATFDQNGGLLTIHAGDRTVINYKRFDVAGGETVRFIQPSATSRVLNRINSAAPSRIDGAIRANGIVYFVNPAGVMFGPNAVINVGQFYAAAGNITDQNFLNNVNRFQATGAVVNAGVINADAVALIGRSVSNAGTISAEGGLVTMVAGDDVLLGTRDGHIMVKLASTQQPTSGASGARPQGGVTNTGTVTAQSTMLAAGDLYSLAIGGSVKSKAVTAQGGGDVAVTGKIDASDTAAGAKGGNVVVTGKNVTLRGATIDASGDAGGGEVLVGGDFQGKGETPRATNTGVDNGTTLTASATGNGDGGKVVVWSDGKTTYNGSIYAKGGATGGNGGQVEVSGKGALAFNGAVDVTAPKGQTGTLLLDPANLTIQLGSPDVHGDGSNLDATGDIAASDDPGANSFITAGQLVTLLNTADVSLAAANDITVSAPVDARTNAGPHSLTLNAGHDITIGLSSAVDLKGGNLSLTAGNVLTLNSDVNTNGGDAFVTAGQIGAGAGRLSANHLTLELNSGMAGGNPLLTAVSGLEAHSTTGDIVVSNWGSVDLGFAGGTKGGVVVDAGNVSVTGDSTISVRTAGHVVSASGDVSLTAGGGDMGIDNFDGVGTGQVRAGGQVSLLASGTMTIGGTGPGDVHAGTGLTVTALSGSVIIDNGSFVETDGGNVSVSAGSQVALQQSSADQAHLWNNGAGSITIDAPTFVGHSGGTPASVRAAGGGGITIKADSVDFADAIDGGATGVVTFVPHTAGTAISLADSAVAGQLTLAGSQLGNVSASKIVIGDATSGDLTVAGTVARGGASWDTIELVTGGSVLGTPTGLIQVDKLAMTAGTGIGTNSQSVGTAVAKLEAGTTTGGIYVANTGDLSIGGVSGSLSGVRAAAGPIVLTNAGSVSVEQAGETLSSGGNISVTATGSTADIVTGGGNSMPTAAVLSTGGAVSLVAGRDVAIGKSDYGDVNAANGLTLQAGRDVTVDNGSFVESSGGSVAVSAGNSVQILQTSFDQAHVWNNNGGITVSAPNFVSNGGGTPAALATFGTGDISIAADTANFPDAIDAGSGVVTFTPYTTGRGITLGGSTVAGTLTLTGAQLGNVSASRIVVGDSNTGDISVAGTVTQGVGWNHLDLVTGGNISDAAGGTLQVDNLSFNAGGSVDLGNQAHAVGTVAGIGAGSVSFKAGGPLAVGSVDGVTGVTSTAGDVTLAADGMTIAQYVTATGGAVNLRPTTGGYGIELGTKPAGVLGLDQSDLDNVDSPVLRIGSASAGDIHIDTVTNGSDSWTTLHLISGGAVRQNVISMVTVPSLAVTAAGDVDMGLYNSIDTVAGSSASGAFAARSTSDLTVGTVDGVSGISATGLSQVYSGGTLTLGQNVSVAGNFLILSGHPGVTQTGGAVTATDLVVYVDGVGNVALTSAGNNVNKFAATVPNGSVSYTDADGVQVSSVNGVDGITAGGAVTLAAGGDVVVDRAVTTGGGDFSATVTGGGFSLVSGTGAIDTRNAAAGSNAGNITVTATGAVSFATDLNVTGTDGNASAGGNGGAVSLTGSSVSVAKIDTRGGAADAAGTDNGGDAGAVTLTATSGSVTLSGNITATGGASTGGTAGSDAAVAVHGPAVLGNNVVITATGVGFDSTLQASTDGGQSLQVTSTGLTTFGGAVGGGGNRLSALTVNGPASIGASISATGNLDFSGPVTAAGDATLTGANVDFTSTVDGGHNLAVTITGPAGFATFDGMVGHTTPLTSLTVTGPAHLNSGSVTTTGSQSYSGGDLPLAVDTTLTGGAITLGGAVDGAHALTLANSGLATIAGTVGGATPLTTLTVNGATQITGSQVKTSAGQTYTGAVTVGGDTTLTGTTLTFSSTVDDTAAGTHNLTLANSGAATFAAAVGGTAPLGSLSVSGTTAVNGGTVKTAGNQAYTGAVSLGADTLVAGSAVNFASTVDGAHALTLNNTGLATFGGAIGGTTALSALTVGGAARIDGGQVKTTAGQTYAGPLTLGNSATLTATTFGFLSTVDGAADATQALTVANGGNATFGGSVGSAHTLSALVVNGAATLDASSVATSGVQTYKGAVTLKRGATLTGSSVAFESTVDANADGGQGLTLGNSAGTVVFGGAVGQTRKLSHVTVAGATSIGGGGSVATAGDQTYTGAFTTNLDATLTGDHVTFGSTVRGLADGGQALTLNGTSAVTFNGAVGDGGKRLASLTVTGPTVLNGSSVATKGDQTYNSAVTLKSNTTLAVGGAVTFASTVNGDAAGAESLAITNTGAATFNAAVGSGASLASLSVSGPAVLNGGSVTTAGAQSYGGATTLGTDTTLAGTTFSFGSTLDAHDDGGQGLTLHNSAVATFGGAVGGVHNLKYLTIDGPAALNGPSIATTGAQTYNGAVIVGGNETLTAPTITFAATVDDATNGTHSLTLTNSDLATFNGAVGAAHPLASLSVAGPLALNTGTVNTTGSQAYNSAVTLSKNATLTASSGGVTFARTVDGPVTLHVNTGGTATFAGDVGGTTALKGLSTSGKTRFGTHGVATVVRVSSPNNGNDADVSAGGNLIVAGDVTVRVTNGARNGVRFGGDIDGDLLGQDTLTVLVPWSERTAGSTQLPLITFASANVGTRSQLRTLRLNATQDADPSNLAAGVDGINGDATPTVATVYAPSGLNANVAQDFTMGRNEKLTAGHGDVAINAGRTAAVGDINAPGNISVTAPNIVLQQRPGSAVYAKADAITDEGLDFVAGGNIHFTGTFVETSPGSRVTLAYGGDSDPGLTTGQIANALVRKLAKPVTDADMTATINGATVPLDLAGSGTSIVDPAVTIAAATHVTLPAPGNEPGISASQMQMLAEIGINARELTDMEVLDGLDGREMYVQAPGSLDVSVGRLYGKVVTDVLNTYSTFFMQEQKGPDGQTAQVDSRAQMHEVLTKALAAYKTAHPSPDFDPQDFRSWCETHVEQRGAVDALDKLRSLLVQVEYLGLTPREMAQVKSELFKGIKPDGITMREFVQAVMGHMAAAQ